MKKLFLAFALVACFAVSALSQGAPPWTIQEVDGSPRVNSPTLIKVTNGTLSCTGKTCTITISGGGGGSPGGSSTQVQYNAAGSFGGISGFTSDGTNVTAGSGNLRATRPRFITSIDDTNGNEVFVITATGSAVNEFTIANAATGNNPTITASGGDANVGINFIPKGSGTIQVSGVPIVTTTATQTLTNKTYDTAGTGNVFRINGTQITDIAGDTGVVATVTGATSNGNCAEWDANGNLQDSGAACGGGGGGGITVGTTTITSGTNTRVLYNNAGVVGEYVITGTGNVVMSAAPTLTGRVSAADGLFATSVTTGTGSSAGLQVTANSLTTGNGTEISSSSVSSGNVVSIAATGTAAASNSKHALIVSTSGANATSTQTTYGAEISNTSTGTSSTNIALGLSASGGTNNVALSVASGQVLLPVGSLSAPSLSATGNTNSGFYFLSGAPTIAQSGIDSVYFGGNDIRINGQATIGFGAGTGNSMQGSTDSRFGRSAAATIRVQGSSTTTAATFSTPALTPAQITSDKNNYAPGTGWFQRWSSDASRNVTGLSAGQDGQLAEIWNVGSNNIVLQNENASSTAANRFTTSTGADLTLTAGKCAIARYDTTSTRWRVYLCN